MNTLEDDVREFRSRVRAAGLGTYGDELVKMARPSIRLRPDSRLGVVDGASRLGGEPELPPKTPWPRWNGRPLSFIAQINLDEIAHLIPHNDLPTSGQLSFFYEAVTQEAWGFEPRDRGAAAVLFTPRETAKELRVAPADLAAAGRFTPAVLRASQELTPPAWESYDVAQLDMPEALFSSYADLTAERPYETTHQLLGNPDPIQNDMQLECQLVTNGVDCGGDYTKDSRVGVLSAGAAKWRLLLQVDSDESIGMMWGDLGRLYYWIHEDDLRQRAWDHSWLILQCG